MKSIVKVLGLLVIVILVAFLTVKLSEKPTIAQVQKTRVVTMNDLIAQRDTIKYHSLLDSIYLNMPTSVFAAVCTDLIKNGIETTPYNISKQFISGYKTVYSLIEKGAVFSKQYTKNLKDSIAKKIMPRDSI
jgi:hypothetical protein